MLVDILKSILRDFSDALLSLKRRPARFLLSGTGIGIGVSALLAMLSIGEGAKQSILGQIESLGINTIRIESTEVSLNQSARNLSDGLTISDMEHLQTAIGTRGIVSGYVRDETIRAQFREHALASLVAATPEWLETENLQLKSGRSLTYSDLTEQRQICVLGSGLATTLQVSTGERVLFGRHLCEVVGILLPKNRFLTNGTVLSSLDFSNIILVPLSHRIHISSDRSRLSGIIILLNSSREDDILKSATAVRNILEQRHQGVDDYSIVVPMHLLIEAKKTQRTFALVMGVIAGLSILVGGIGVMNVMLANITEQTREIGLRMAVGASRSRIISLYLWQSVQLTLLSGLWGVVGGIIIALSIQSYAGWPIAFSLFGLFIGPCSAVLTGVLFGLQPAILAAATSPAIALREN